MVAPIKSAINLNKPYDLILNALLAAVSFRVQDEQGRYFPSDEEFFSEACKGTNHILRNICRLNITIPG